MDRRRLPLDAILSTFVSVHPHEISPLLHSSSCFFFILSAYFVVLPLRDEAAISLGLSNLPSLFVGSLTLTLIAAPLSTLLFSLPNFSKCKALILIHRFFSLSLAVFFFLWHFSSSAGFPFFKSKGTIAISTELKQDLKVDDIDQISLGSWGNHGWFYISVRIGLFLWVALLNLITISSIWARVIDVMDNESGSRLFGFIGADATFGQLFGSLFAAVMACFTSIRCFVDGTSCKVIKRYKQGCVPSSRRIISHKFRAFHLSKRKKELIFFCPVEPDQQTVADGSPASEVYAPKSPTSRMKPQIWAIFDGIRLILSSTYLLYVSLFLWLSAVISSFFYFQKVTVIAMAISSSVGRRRLFAQINSFIAVFILAGQLTLTGRILTLAGVTAAICSAPVVAFSNLIAVAVWPTWAAVAVCETIRKVVTYVVTRSGRELLFTVITQEEKYKAKVCIDVIVQRLGDATAAGMYKLLFSTLHGRTSTVSLYALPVCLLWIFTAFRQQGQLAKLQAV